MGIRDLFRGKRKADEQGKGRELWVRPDYKGLPSEDWTEDELDHWWATCTDDEYWAEWEAWSRHTKPHPRVTGVRRTCLDLCLEAAKETDDPGPSEFACLLRVDDGVVTEPVLLPGTVSGDEHAIFNLWMQPVDKHVRGSLHSHPDTHPYPSDADAELFSAHGEIHLILCRPYGPDDWRAYDHKAQPVSLEVVDG